MRIDLAHDATGISDGDNIGGDVFCHDASCIDHLLSPIVTPGMIIAPGPIFTFLLTYQLFFGIRTVSSDCNRTAYPDKRPVMTFAKAAATYIKWEHFISLTYHHIAMMTCVYGKIVVI